MKIEKAIAENLNQDIRRLETEILKKKAEINALTIRAESRLTDYYRSLEAVKEMTQLKSMLTEKVFLIGFSLGFIFGVIGITLFNG